jgi:hypothetical protein
MLRKRSILVAAMVLAGLSVSSKAHAWGAIRHYGFTTYSPYSGLHHYGYTAAYRGYGGYGYSAYRYGGYGYGGYHYGYDP